MSLGKRLRTQPVQANTDTGTGAIDWRSMSPAERKARVEGWSATRELHAADWINAAVLLDELYGAETQGLDADGKLRHYARQHPEVILTEAASRAQTPDYSSGRGSPVPDPWTFAGEPQPGWWG